MATLYDRSNGYAGQETKIIHSGDGALLAIIISHAEATTQTVTLYDGINVSSTVLATFQVAPDRSPAYVEFPDDFPLRFTDGLTVEAGNCYVNVLATGR